MTYHLTTSDFQIEYKNSTIDDTVIFGNHGPLIKASYGGSLTLRKDTTIVFSAEGDGAGWFEPSSVDGQEMWIGEWRGTARIRD